MMHNRNNNLSQLLYVYKFFIFKYHQIAKALMADFNDFNIELDYNNHAGDA